MRKIIAALLTLTLLCSIASFALAGGGDDVWIVNNPNPSDRLNLRVGMDENEFSLGKYYNGTRVTVLDTADDPWFKVRIGGESGSQIGYMNRRYLSASAEADFINRMPMYVTTKGWKAYRQPDKTASYKSLGKFMRIYVIGVTGEGWWHVLVRSKEGDDCYFVPSGTAGFTSATAAYVSNPDKADRLHLRAKPDKTSQSLGKYYNGTRTVVMGQSMDLEWSYVNVYGRTGFMLSKYLCYEGEYNYTYTGLVNVNVTSDTSLMREPDSSARRLATLSAGDELTVYGVLEGWLHVASSGGKMGFVERSRTDYVDGR